MTEDRSSVYRGTTREAAERAYHADARLRVRDGYVPASEDWTTALGQQVLTVRYVHAPDQAPAVLDALSAPELDAGVPSGGSHRGATRLGDRISHWVGEGYRVVAQTPTSAQLVRPRQFNPAEFIAMPLYLFEYLGQRDKTVYLAVEPDGSVSEKGSALERSRYRRAQDRSGAGRLAVVVGGFFLIIVVALVIQAIT